MVTVKGLLYLPIYIFTFNYSFIGIRSLWQTMLDNKKLEQETNQCQLKVVCVLYNDTIIILMILIT